METIDCEEDVHLPPIAATPRFLTAQTHSVTTQPSDLQPSSKSLPWSSRQVAPVTNETPRRSLKQVSKGHRAWASGLCDCWNDSFVCFFSCICPCYIKWSIAKYLGETRCVACIPGSGAAMRTKVRALGGIEGSILQDMCVTWCCPCLGISQTMREVDHMIVQPEIYVKPVHY